MRTKVGVIGCGYWGPKLIRNFATMEDVELSWIADLRADRLEAMASLYPQARITRDYQEILRSDVEAVVVATPVSRHWPRRPVRRRRLPSRPKYRASR